MMSIRLGAMVGVGCFLLALSGCSTITIDESNAGSIQTLSVGDVLRVRLNGNATTGYEWVRTEPDTVAESPLTILKEGEYLTSRGQLVGAPGVFTFSYRAVCSGSMTLRFEHRRPWEPEDPIDSYTVHIWVR